MNWAKPAQPSAAAALPPWEMNWSAAGQLSKPEASALFANFVPKKAVPPNTSLHCPKRIAGTVASNSRRRQRD
ncbi:MAG: hypothetical protein JO010_10055 [Alphaproteobacteria bacterium]|nr:hypothetical protein [Alphaproteobacteria bacterium]